MPESLRKDLRELPIAAVIGAGGLGMAIARRMAQQHHVVLADIQRDVAERQAEQLRSEGAIATAIQCDVTRRKAVEDLRSCIARAGPLRTVQHVAGLSIAANDFSAIVQVNLLGPALVCETLLPLAAPGSSAVLIASMAAHLSSATEATRQILASPTDPDLARRLMEELGPENATPAAAYALSKIGLLSYARAKVSDWGARGARIVSLSPGLIATPMGEAAYEKSEGKRRMFEKIPLSREGSMQEIADTAEFLASDRASFISGTDLLVDGGLSSALTACA